MSNPTPDGWAVYRVGELARVKRGASPRPIQDPKWWGGLVGWVRISDVTSSYKYLTKTTQYLSADGVSKSVRIPKGEVILSICATIGRPIIVGVDACIHDGFVWFDKLKSSINREYWYYFLSAKEEFLSGQRQSGTQGNLNTSIVSELECLLPPLPEQQKIAAILSSVDEVIEKTRAQIDKLKDLKTGMMQELLTKGIGPDGKPHTEFKDSPVGRIPDSWNLLTLSELVSSDRPITYGIVQTGENIPDGIPCVRVVDLMRPTISAKDMIRTSNKVSQQYKRTVLRKGDIMFALRGEIGHVRLTSAPLVGANLTRGVALISPNEITTPRYLLWALRSPGVRSIIMDGVNGSALQEIPLGNLRNVQVPIPSMDEQIKISAALDAVENSFEQKQRKLGEQKSLKKALMQDLLTGKVRVNVEEKEAAVG